MCRLVKQIKEEAFSFSSLSTPKPTRNTRHCDKGAAAAILFLHDPMVQTSTAEELSSQELAEFRESRYPSKPDVPAVMHFMRHDL